MNEFIRRLKNSKALTVLLSVVIACIVWIYVVNAENPDINDTIRNVPITVAGQTVLEERGLMITDQSVDKLDLRLTGKRNALVNLTNKNITVSADVSSVSGAGSFDLPCTVTLPTSITGGTVTVNNRETYRVTVAVEKRVKKTIEIRGNFSGSIAKGYQAGQFTLSPSRIEISGPESVLEKIGYARVNLAGNNLKETYSGLLPIELVSDAGEIIGIDEVECAASSIYTVYPIEMVREVDLSVEFIAGGGATKENISYEIFPSRILLSGEEASLVDLQTISLGTIDLAEIAGNSVLLLPVELPEGVKSEDGIDEVKVSVKFEGLTVRTLEVSRFQLVNAPEDYIAGMVSTSVQVVIRGPVDAVAAVRPDQLLAEVDLSGITPEVGEIEVPVKISISQTNGVGVIGGNYTARVALTR